MTTKTKRKGGKGKATATARTLSAKRETARKRNAKRGVKLPYEDKGANYLRDCVAQALALPAITPAEVRTSQSVVMVDARKVVRHLTPNLWKRPDLTIHARLVSMTKYAPEVAKVAYLRYLPSTKHPEYREGSDSAYLVMLYRTK